MTPHDRFLACMRFRSPDRPPLWEWGPWPSTLRRWRREGLGPDESPPQLAECDAKLQCGVDLWNTWLLPAHVLTLVEESFLRELAVARTGCRPLPMPPPDRVRCAVCRCRKGAGSRAGRLGRC